MNLSDLFVLFLIIFIAYAAGAYLGSAECEREREQQEINQQQIPSMEAIPQP